MVSRSCRIAIIGGGIVGCALARQLAPRFSDVVVLEKEADVGAHTSGRNSGVIHSGFNAKPGSLKAKLGVQGSAELRRFCAERGVPWEQVGTYVVATSEAECPVLEDLRARGQKNGVPGLEILTTDYIREHEPNVKGIMALHSPTGAIVDSRALTRAVADDAKERGARIALGLEVRRIRETADVVMLETPNETFRAELLINCAGLHADRLAHRMGVGRDYVMVPFRGEYFEVRRDGPPLLHSMVYPVPNPLVPFLGVHLTRTVAGSILIGPNAVPAFGREAYERFGFTPRDIAEMLGHQGIWKALLRNRALLNVAWHELRNSCSQRYFFHEAARLINGLHREDLSLAKRVGIRPQLIGSDGQLVEDLVIETTRRSIHILNVISPGMTSALAFAGWLSARVTDRLEWGGEA